MMENKLKTTEKLSLKQIREICFKILQKEGYSNLEVKDDKVIVGETKEGLSTIITAFLLNEKPLSGVEINIKALKTELDILNTNFKPNNIILISNQTISGQVENELKNSFQISIIARDDFSSLVSKHFPEYWTYQRLCLVDYEKSFLEEMAEKSALLNIQGLEKKVKKLLNIYIKPKVYEIKEDLESDDFQKTRVNEKDILDSKKPCIVEGDTGSGKSTLLKEIGKLQIREQKDLKILPVIISPLFLYSHSFSVKDAAFTLLKKHVKGSWDEILSSYGVLLMIDNIDEFEEKIRKGIIKELNDLFTDYNIRYILTTRSIEMNNLSTLCSDVKLFQIRKFDDTQIKEFALKFFEDQNLANDLLDSLRDNRILERLPLTPLSISLISLVYEKENHEIPATISDIYDNFNSLILGKILADNKFELINFSFRERILSAYAFHLLIENKLKPLKKDDFINFFKRYFSEKASNVSEDVIESFLDYLIRSSGILNIVDDGYIQFSHKSFLEYYASLEIFKHKRDFEKQLVENFLDLNWQNVGIFYAGQSKDLPDFLNKIISQTQEATDYKEYYSSITGLGYLLQALYQTDNNLRKKAVYTALNHVIELHNLFQKISYQNDFIIYNKIKLPVISIINMYYFYVNFLSSTLKEPLKLVFNELWDRYLVEKQTTIGYQLLMIALIFHSKRLNDSSLLQKLIFDSEILKDPSLVTIAEFSIYFNRSEEHKKMKKELKKSFLKMNDVIRILLNTPAKRLRFSNLDTINPLKKVLLLTEGSTDVDILEKAYHALTGNSPYWSARPVGIKTGGAKELKFTIEKSKPLTDDESITIAIFDNDTEGINQFKGLNKYFEPINKRVKKANDKNIYAIKIPVPHFRSIYKNNGNENQYFSIEHYFEDEFLKKYNMLIETGIPNIYKINDKKSSKKAFSKAIQELEDPKIFAHFIVLFETIDKITETKIDYNAKS